MKSSFVLSFLLSILYNIQCEEITYAKLPSWMTDLTSKIVGGTTAKTPIPWQVHVHINRTDKEGIQGCGGTILDEETILSAAHCYYPTSITTIQFIEAGIVQEFSKKGQNVKVKEIIVHPDYDESRKDAKWDNDIAILKLETPLIFNKNVKPALLPNPSFNLKPKVAVVSGWGKTRSGARRTATFLKYVAVPLITNEMCVKPNTNYKVSEITSNMICAGDLVNGKRDACAGDSGGPLIISKSDNDKTAIVYGIVSFGFLCGRSDGPGVYVRVSNYINWIQNKMKEPEVPCQDNDDIDISNNIDLRTTVICKDGKDTATKKPPMPRNINVPEAVEIFYDTVMSNLGTYGQNLTIIKEALADDWNMRPNPLNLFKANIFEKFNVKHNPQKGIASGPFPKGIKPIWDFVSVMLPNLKYERRHTFVIDENTVAVVTRLEATVGDVPPSFSEFSMFPGIDPQKLKGKSFVTMALDVHILDKGKIRRTWHVTDWTLALDEMLETGRAAGSLDWPSVKKGEILTEVPQCIYNFYDKILSDPAGGGQDNSLLAKTMHTDSIVRPKQSILDVDGLDGLKVTTRFLGDVMPDIKYKIQKTWLHEDKVIVLSKVSATVVKNSGSIPSFPGADTKKLFLKKFEILGISVHRIVNGKIKQTYHIDDWQLAVNQMLSDRTDSDFGFYPEYLNF